MSLFDWNRCLDSLSVELTEQQYNTWIRPLVAKQFDDRICLVAPNRFIRNWVQDRFLQRFRELYKESGNNPEALSLGLAEEIQSLGNGVANNRVKENLSPGSTRPDGALADNRVNWPLQGSESADLMPVGRVRSMPGSRHGVFGATGSNSYQAGEGDHTGGHFLSGKSNELEPVSLMANSDVDPDKSATPPVIKQSRSSTPSGPGRLSPAPKSYVADVQSEHQNPARKEGHRGSALNSLFTFTNFVEGASNQLALAAARQVAENPGEGYNPLFIYGGVGLGKTHLMHSVGNALRNQNPNAKVVYLHSERFVADMVKALQLNAINDFKRHYRSVDALLIDDIQFFAKKDRSQEEFFHTFNNLFEGGQQMIFTCDRYPKEIDGLEERLKSRFGWGLTVAVEPPELETRAAILMKKADQAQIEIPPDVAFFIAQRVRSNVRELEGALKRVIASAQFTGRPITLDMVKESLKDLLSMQERLVTIENIQKVVAEYYKIKLNDLLSKKRTRSLARPRQVAMTLAKELTSRSLPEIGEAFGGRDHTTVLHARRKIAELELSNADIREDLKNLNRILST